MAVVLGGSGPGGSGCVPVLALMLAEVPVQYKKAGPTPMAPRWVCGGDLYPTSHRIFLENKLYLPLLSVIIAYILGTYNNF